MAFAHCAERILKKGDFFFAKSAKRKKIISVKTEDMLSARSIERGRRTMTHELKLNRRFFHAVASGKKTFEIRKDDRGYKVGDILILKEWDDIMSNYSGKSCMRQITYIYNGNGQYGLARSYVVLALKEVEA